MEINVASPTELFEAAKYSASLFIGKVKDNPNNYIPEQFRWDKDSFLNSPRPIINVSDNEISYETASGKGLYIFKPGSFCFRGYRNSFIRGCLMVCACLVGPLAPLRSDGYRYEADKPPVTPRNAVRVDVSIWAPIGLYYTLLDYFELYNPTITSSIPDKPLY